MSATAPALGLRAALVIGLASAFTAAIAAGLGLGSGEAAYGVIVAALVVRPDFSRWPLPIYPVLVGAIGLSMAIGLLMGEAFAGAPTVFVFGLVAATMQFLMLLLPGKLRPLANVLAITGVLPLLSATSSWTSVGNQVAAIGLGLAVGSITQIALTPAGLPLKAEQTKESVGAEPPLAQRLRTSLASAFFWRKLVFAALALAIGEGLGAVEPKYLYFGVVLLLNDNLGATLARVRDRMVGVTLGILMPLLVFNSIGLNEVSTGLVLGGTAALMVAVNRQEVLRTALISSGVAFVGYGPLVAWYIPHRWIDYLMGCGLALAAGLMFRPTSALNQYRALLLTGEASAESLARLRPAAMEEARWLGQSLAAPASVGEPLREVR
jgi:hypothetical protein